MWETLGGDPAPWTVASPGFCDPPTEPHGHLSMYTALQPFLDPSSREGVPLACLPCAYRC